MASDSPSIYDLAKELNVSVSTVSRALSDHPSISQATKKRVHKLALAHNYQPNQVATALSKGQGSLLGVIVPHVDGYFFGSVIRGIERVARRAGYNIIICQSNEEEVGEQESLTAVLGARVAGIIMCVGRGTKSFQHVEKSTRGRTPVVLFDRVLDGLSANAVLIDDYGAAYDMTLHLLDQGSQRVAHLAGPQHLSTYKNRLGGYRAALQQRGFAVDERLVYCGDVTTFAGAAGMAQLLELPPAKRPDAVFSASDFAALGALQELKRHGLRVPADVLLAGFSNEPFTSFIEPPLTTVDQQSEQMGESTVTLLLEMLSRGPGKAPANRHVVLKPTLLIRESSLRPLAS